MRTLSNFLLYSPDAPAGAGAAASSDLPDTVQATLYGGKDTPNPGDSPPADDTPPAETVNAEGDTPPGDDTTPAEGEDTAAGDNPDEVPEAYELRMPEGVEVDKELLAAVTPIAKELKLNNAGMQKLADVVAQQELKRAEAWQTTRENWIKEAKADAKIGGAKWNETVELSNRAVHEAIAGTGRTDLAEILKDTGGGCHPAMIAAFAYFGAKLADDTPVLTTPAGGQRKFDVVDVLYGKS